MNMRIVQKQDPFVFWKYIGKFQVNFFCRIKEKKKTVNCNYRKTHEQTSQVSFGLLKKESLITQQQDFSFLQIQRSQRNNYYIIIWKYTHSTLHIELQ